MMIVVAVIGVLAALGTVAYTRYVRASHAEEAQDMVVNIRAAEEAFLAENGAYLDVSGCVGTGCSYPSQTPGSFATAWGGACGWCKNPAIGWTGLTVAPSVPVYYGYSVIADSTNPPSSRGLGTQMYNGQPLNLSALGAHGAPWYFVEADGNITGDGVNFTHVYGMSGSKQIFVNGAGN
jgi:type II secretory pathway pseudopilin PulG